MKVTKTGLSAFVLLAVLAILTVGSSVRADYDPDDPPIVEIYNLDGEIVTELTVDVDEPFTLVGMAIGNQPLTYHWLLDGVEVSTSPVLLDFTISDPGVHTMTLTVVDVNGLSTSKDATITVLASKGSICGTVSDNSANPLEGVTVNVLDGENNPAADPVVTGSDGAYLFEELDIAAYSVSIVTPLGFVASPGETQIDIEPADPCTVVEFVLTPTITTNDSRTMGFWKHQFDSYLNGHGTAAVAEADLESYLDNVYDHFDILAIYTELGTFDFEDAKDALAVRGNEALVEAAKQQLFAMLLNFAAGNIGNYSVVTEDSRKACEVVTFAADAIHNGDETAHQTAADICAIVNRGGLAPAGVVAASSVVYKLGGGSLPNEFRLEQNHPNPFNPSTDVQFYLPEATRARLEIFNVSGQLVTVLADRAFAAGWHSLTWNARSAASGVYLYRLTAGDKVETKKMILLK